ncbi:hypothetical protein NQ317_005744 [Molorchus minor]|uniref:U4/U6 small nuclear ribonucleoprotein Prp31 n=1 Tax=Molorchus minor TaxID=1323400 RepID=A0ABQ9JM38_9CUCU|nr:hypothetical protein NQ317_005744 [Molorchus minor]
MSVILGASIAAKIMGVAGGLTRLSKIPACNVLLLGQQKKSLIGTTTLPHTGFVYYADIVQNTPPDLRRKAARLVATKCTLAARVDACHESADGRIGRQLRDEIERKLDKLQEPPPVKFVKPLPKPIDQSKKKKGGKRVRKMKERYALTEFRKHANRMNFADIEDDAYQEDLGYTRGTLGKAGTGRIRLPQVDEKTKVRISKTLQKNLQKQQIWGGSTTVKKQISGTASSVAFTPLQGLESVNPQAAEVKVNEANAKYFSNTSVLRVLVFPTKYFEKTICTSIIRALNYISLAPSFEDPNEELLVVLWGRVEGGWFLGLGFWGLDRFSQHNTREYFVKKEEEECKNTKRKYKNTNIIENAPV